MLCVWQSSPLTFHYVIVSRSSVVASRSNNAPTIRLSSVTDSRQPPPPPATDKQPTGNDDVLDNVVDREELAADDVERTVSRGCDEARHQTSTVAGEHDDGCLSISTSVTVVISRRPAPASSSSTAVDHHVATDDGDTPAATGKQVVLNTKVTQQPEVEMTASCETETGTTTTEKPSQDEPRSGQDSTASHVTTDVTRATGSCRPKRKSLESVIKSLQPRPIIVSRQPEVARTRPEVLVRPMQACADARPNVLPVSTQAVRPISHLFTPYRQPEAAVDLRRPKRPAPTGSSVVPGVGRRKPKSLSPLQAPHMLDDPYYSDKRRRFNSGGDAGWSTGARLGCYFPPTPGLRYHACMAPARPDMTRLPVYYGGALQRRAEPNGYDAPLELTTKRARDRK